MLHICTHPRLLTRTSIPLLDTVSLFTYHRKQITLKRLRPRHHASQWKPPLDVITRISRWWYSLEICRFVLGKKIAALCGLCFLSKCKSHITKVVKDSPLVNSIPSNHSWFALGPGVALEYVLYTCATREMWKKGLFFEIERNLAQSQSGFKTCLFSRKRVLFELY